MDVATVLKQIDDVLAETEKLTAPYRNRALVNMDDDVAGAVVTLLTAAIERLAPSGSTYLAQSRKVQESQNASPASGWLCDPLMGVLKAMRIDYAAGRLVGVRELLHAELFGDFLDAAQHLLDEGYKDPAAVIAGSSLEAHLRKVADKHSVPTTAADGSAKKASLLTADLAKTTPPALSKGDAKNVTAWLDLRNDAAHGHYAKYTKEQVALLIQSVRDFITRVPA